MIYYFYKITNNINQKFYYGVHKTKNINDGYMGSGSALMHAYKKYGIENFTKNILKYFNTEDEMYKYEREIVTPEMVKSRECYNLTVGGRRVDARRISEGLHKYWKEGDVEWKKKKRVDAARKSIKVQNWLKKIREAGENKGYKNFDFKNRWEGVYLKDSNLICHLIQHSNLPEEFILKHFFPNKKIKIPRLLRYYEYIGKLPNRLFSDEKFMFLKFSNADRKGHRSGKHKKTYYSKDIRYKFFFYYKDFWDEFEVIKKIRDNLEISDSMVQNERGRFGIKHYDQIIKYMEEIGVIENVRVIDIRSWRSVAGKVPFTNRAKKTIFDVKNKINGILISKENDYYEIGNDGKAVRIGRIELFDNEGKCSLQYIREEDKGQEF